MYASEVEFGPGSDGVGNPWSRRSRVCDLDPSPLENLDRSTPLMNHSPLLSSLFHQNQGFRL